MKLIYQGHKKPLIIHLDNIKHEIYPDEGLDPRKLSSYAIQQLIDSGFKVRFDAGEKAIDVITAADKEPFKFPARVMLPIPEASPEPSEEVSIEEEEPEEDSCQDENAEEMMRQQLEDMSYKEVCQRAKKKGVDLPGGRPKKADAINLIIQKEMKQ